MLSGWRQDSINSALSRRAYEDSVGGEVVYFSIAGLAPAVETICECNIASQIRIATHRQVGNETIHSCATSQIGMQRIWGMKQEGKTPSTQHGSNMHR